MLFLRRDNHTLKKVVYNIHYIIKYNKKLINFVLDSSLDGQW